MMEKRLYRSRKERKIAGVCGGIAEYFKLDPTLIRLAFILLICFAGGGLLAYIVCAIVIPNAPED
jgi:phage shock protein C